MGQRQKGVEGRAWGGEVRKREIGVVGKIERGVGKEQGVVVVVVGLVEEEEEDWFVVVSGSELLFTRFRAGASIMEESRLSSPEAFRFLEGS